MKTKIKIFLLALLVSACSFSFLGSTKKETPSDASVVPSLETKTATETVQNPSEKSSSIETSRNPNVALILGPGLHRVSSQIAFLRALEEKKIKIQMIEGHEMGAIVAALYALYQSAEKVEWIFYKYFRSHERADVLTSSWREDVSRELLSFLGKDSCKNLRIEKMKIPLYIPIYISQSKKVELLRVGPLCEALVSNLTLAKEGERFSAAFEWRLFNSTILKKSGADIVIGVDSLGSQILLRKEKPEVQSLYERLLKIRDIEKNYVDLFVSLPTDDMPMDGTENLPLVSRKSQVTSEKFASEILDRIQKWKEKKL